MNIKVHAAHTRISLCAVLFAAAGIAVADGGAHGGGVFGEVVTVDCNHHRASITRALSRPRLRRPKVIHVIGECHEDVSIEQDGVTLRGGQDGGSTIVGEITARGAQRVVIEHLQVTGPGSGVVALEGSAVRVSNAELVDNEGSGALALRNALLEVSDSVVTGNSEGGLVASQNATMRSNGNRVFDNPLYAVSIGNFSYFRSGRSPSDPSIRDVFIQPGCLQGDAATSGCGEEDTFALDCYRNGVCDVRDSDLTGQISVVQLSILELRSSTVNGNVGLRGGSNANTRSNVTGSGVISCGEEAFATRSVGCGEAFPPPSDP